MLDQNKAVKLGCLHGLQVLREGHKALMAPHLGTA